MTNDPDNELITTVDEFEMAFGKLLKSATCNDIDPRGSWVFRSDDETDPDWEAEIVELAPDGLTEQ